jgi:hypothetical protein
MALNGVDKVLPRSHGSISAIPRLGHLLPATAFATSGTAHISWPTGITTSAADLSATTRHAITASALSVRRSVRHGR